MAFPQVSIITASTLPQLERLVNKELSSQCPQSIDWAKNPGLRPEVKIQPWVDENGKAVVMAVVSYVSLLKVERGCAGQQT